MEKKRTQSIVMLFIASFIWGSGFVAQSAGMAYIRPFTYTAVRSFISFIAIAAALPLLDKLGFAKRDPAKRRTLWIAGFFCGALLFIASNCQQWGILTTSVGKAGFITSMYIVLVPIFAIVIGQKTRWIVWLSAGIALAGLYLLSVKEGFSIGSGDLLIMACAFFFAIHILVIDHYSSMVDCVRLSCIQFLVCGILSSIPTILLEKPQATSILAAWLPLLYAGLLSGGVAFTLQIIAQRNLDAPTASLLFSLESVFSALCGWVILGQVLSGKELAGCALVFCAVLISQIPAKKAKAVISPVVE